MLLLLLGRVILFSASERNVMSYEVERTRCGNVPILEIWLLGGVALAVAVALPYEVL